MTTEELIDATYTLYSDRYKILKAQRDYTLWAKFAQYTFENDGNWSYINQPCPKNPSRAEASGRSTAAKALRNLLDDQISSTFTETDPHELWFALEKRFGMLTPATIKTRKQRLRRPFNSKRDDPVAYVLEHYAVHLEAKRFGQPMQLAEKVKLLHESISHDPQLEYIALWTTFTKQPWEAIVENLFQTVHVIKQLAHTENVLSGDDPSPTLEVARKRDDWPVWHSAIEETLMDMWGMKAWTVVPRDTSKRVLSSKMVLHVERDADDSEQYTAKIVARGFEQERGIDYDETFRPVASHQTILTFLTVAAHHRMHVHHVSFVSASLNVPLKEELYLEPIPGLDPKVPEGCVYKLEKAIYGLHQSPREWWLLLRQHILSVGWRQLLSDQCMFIMDSPGGRHEYLLVYSEDVYIAAHSPQSLKAIKEKLTETFRAKDLGVARLIADMRVNYNREDGVMYLDQEALIYKHAVKYLSPEERMPVPRYVGFEKDPKEPNFKPIPLLKKAEYQSRIGALLQIASHTRPDISSEVGRLARLSHCFNMLDCIDLRLVFQHLLHYSIDQLKVDGNAKLRVTTFADATWEGEESQQSSFGTITYLGETPILWTCKRQTNAALNDSEAQLHSVISASQDALWLQHLLEEMLPKLRLDAPSVHCNHATAAFIRRGKLDYEATHDVSVHYMFMQDHLKKKTLELRAISDEQNPACIIHEMPQFSDRAEQLKLGVYQGMVEAQIYGALRQI